MTYTFTYTICHKNNQGGYMHELIQQLELLKEVRDMANILPQQEYLDWLDKKILHLRKDVLKTEELISTI